MLKQCIPKMANMKTEANSLCSPCYYHVIPRWWWLLVVWWCWSVAHTCAAVTYLPQLPPRESENMNLLRKWNRTNIPLSGQLTTLQDCASLGKYTYVFKNNKTKCVTEKECLTMKHVICTDTQRCLEMCPEGYRESSSHSENTGVCESVWVINNLDKLKTLENCTVIEGSLQIVLIKDVSDTEWGKWNFSKLVEITDFLLVYQVHGLISLGQLFPNLAVIRGMKLHQHYALVLYDTSLKCIGLHNLRAVLRGSVRIQSNVNLCYVSTVNWTSIVANYSDSVFKDNGERLCNRCCPSCPDEPPLMEGHSVHCWNATARQEICSPVCDHGCTPDNKCCHKECAGGCLKANDASACRACRHYKKEGMCVDACPVGYLEYKGYRCVSWKFCDNSPYHRFEERSQCVAECPEGYADMLRPHGTKNVTVCERCVKPCAKPCPGLLVNTIARAQELRGCTVINGSLIISIKYGKTVTKELEESLGSIQRVTHYVHIFDTSPLKSLNFLASLRVIDGYELYNRKYALYVQGNINLEEIWDWDKHPKLTITEMKGKILFLLNPMLCFHQKIERLLNMTGQNSTEDFNMQLTNGNKVACSIMEQKVTLKPLHYKGVVMLEWFATSTSEDDRKITGYFIYYRESNKTDMSHMDGRDACNDEWKRKHVEIKTSVTKIRTHLYGLKPSCQYAIYVETDTVADADIGARSNINYTKTKPFNPSEPVGLRVIDNGTTYIVISWYPPRAPNGEIHDYIVTRQCVTRHEEVPEAYCSDKFYLEGDMELQKAMTNISREDGDEATPSPPECCLCLDEAWSQESEQDFIDFQDRLYDSIYMHRPSRRKRSIDSTGDISNNFSAHEENSKIHLPRGIKPDYKKYNNEVSWEENGVWNIRTQELTLNLTNLNHSTRYRVQVFACHSHTPCPDNLNYNCVLCSQSPASITASTDIKADANKVNALSVENATLSSLQVTWSSPTDPNGPVLAYKLSVGTMEDATPIKEVCLKPHEFSYNLNISALKPATRHWISVEAYTRATKDINERPERIFFTTETEGSNQVVIFAMMLVVPVIAIACGIFLFRRGIPLKPSAKEITANPCYPHDPGSPQCTIPKENQLNISDLKLDQKLYLGKGKFGIVVKAEMNRGSERIPVAVKQATNCQAREDILQEAKLMLKMKCHHLVQAYGVVLGHSHTFLVMEFMNQGDLLKYLRVELKAQNKVLTTDEICAMAIQIADGMAYLASNKIVHRDLAARNCLVSDHLKIKISDFGMTRITDKNYYQIIETKYFPVRWLAPENLTKHRFTSQSDVWSYGIVLWEILTGGARPYKELHANTEVWKKVSQGYTLKKDMPPNTPECLARLIPSCWEFHGHNRPYFPQIITALLPHASPCFTQLFRTVSFYHTVSGQKYKEEVDSYNYMENETDSPLHLPAASPLPFKPSPSSQGLPLPARLKWRPPFRLHGSMSTCPGLLEHPIPSGTSQLVSPAQQGMDDLLTKGNEQSQAPLHKAHTTNLSFVNQDSIPVLTSETHSFISSNESICPRFSSSTSGEGNKPVRLQKPPPERNVVVNLDKYGCPSSTLSKRKIK